MGVRGPGVHRGIFAGALIMTQQGIKVKEFSLLSVHLCGLFRRQDTILGNSNQELNAMFLNDYDSEAHPFERMVGVVS